MGTIIIIALFVCSIYLAGRIAERRGRSFKLWAWIDRLRFHWCSCSRTCTERMVSVPKAHR
jgi:hypothetical protein